MKIKIMSLLDIVGEKIFDSFQEYDAIVIRKCKQDAGIVLVNDGEFEGVVQKTKYGEVYALCWRRE